jgi:oxysterol-binding protein-related protein 8
MVYLSRGLNSLGIGLYHVNVTHGISAGTIMEGRAVLTLLNRDNEEYVITQPNMYARFTPGFTRTNLIRGILFGRMKFELGDHSMIRCEKTGLVADIEFKTKGFISGTYNAISGKIRRDSPNGEALYEISGKWTEEMWSKNLRTGEKELLFNAEGAKHTPCQVRPLEEQEERESRRLWSKVTQAIIKRDQTVATDAKSAIEDRQREETRARDADGVTWQPRFFKQVDESFYILNHKM